MHVLKRLINDIGEDGDSSRRNPSCRGRPREKSRERVERRAAPRCASRLLLRSVSLFSGRSTRLALNPYDYKLPWESAVGQYALSEARERQRMHACMHAWVHDAHTRPLARSLARSRETLRGAGRLIYRRYRAHLTRNPQLRISCRQCVPMNSILPGAPLFLLHWLSA